MFEDGKLHIWSLFSGIGGLERGLEQSGLGRTVLQCEIEDYPRSILAKHWPDAMRFRDVRDIGNRQFDEQGIYHPCDLICGGFPCQPVSLAGKGKAQADERWLWPEFERIVGEFRPKFVVAENVPGLRKRGLVDVLRGLASLGYDAEWIRLSAAAVGAPHLRERLFIVAYLADARSERRQQVAEGTPRNEEADAGRTTQEDHQPDSDGQGHRAGRDPSASAQVPDTDSEGRRGEREHAGPSVGREEGEQRDDALGLREDLEDEGPWIFTDELRARLPLRWEATSWKSEPNVGRVAHGIPKRVDRLRALGNAVVPQCAEFVGKAIKEAIER